MKKIITKGLGVKFHPRHFVCYSPLVCHAPQVPQRPSTCGPSDPNGSLGSNQEEANWSAEACTPVGPLANDSGQWFGRPKVVQSSLWTSQAIELPVFLLEPSCLLWPSWSKQHPLTLIVWGQEFNLLLGWEPYLLLSTPSVSQLMLTVLSRGWHVFCGCFDL